MIKQTIAEELRAKQSRDNRELLDRAADYIETLEREKAEVAAEIFAEIDAIREKTTAGNIMRLSFFRQLAELKKKYTEGPDNAIQT